MCGVRKRVDAEKGKKYQTQSPIRIALWISSQYAVSTHFAAVLS